MNVRLTRRFANGIDACRMVVLRAVRGVEAEHIDARCEELTQKTRRIGGRSECGYNFGIWHPVQLS